MYRCTSLILYLPITIIEEDVIGGGCGKNDATGGGCGEEDATGGCGEEDATGGGGGEEDATGGGCGEEDVTEGVGEEVAGGGCGEEDVTGGGEEDVTGGGCGEEDVIGLAANHENFLTTRKFPDIQYVHLALSMSPWLEMLYILATSVVHVYMHSFVLVYMYFQ